MNNEVDELPEDKGCVMASLENNSHCIVWLTLLNYFPTLEKGFIEV